MFRAELQKSASLKNILKPKIVSKLLRSVTVWYFHSKIYYGKLQRMQEFSKSFSGKARSTFDLHICQNWCYLTWFKEYIETHRRTENFHSNKKTKKNSDKWNHVFFCAEDILQKIEWSLAIYVEIEIVYHNFFLISNILYQ